MDFETSQYLWLLAAKILFIIGGIVFLVFLTYAILMCFNKDLDGPWPWGRGQKRRSERKKLIPILSILCLLLSAPSAYAGTCVAQGTGNWSATATWGTTCNGATPAIPAAGDAVQLAGYVITWDVASGARIPATSGSLTTITSTSSAGQIAVDLSNAACNSSACSLNATSITAGTKPSTAGVLLITGTTSNVLTVNAAVTGGSNTYAYGINNQSTAGGLTVVGAIHSGSGSASYGIYHNSTGTLAITGDVTGGGSYGVYNKLAGTVNVTGHVKGGTATTSYGLYNDSTGAITVSDGVEGGSNTSAYGLRNDSTGAVTITGDIKGGEGSGAVGLSNGGATSPTLIDSNLIWGSGASPLTGVPPTWTPGTEYGLQIGATYLYDETDRNTDPGEAQVQTGTSYKFHNVTKNGSLVATTSGGGGAFGF